MDVWLFTFLFFGTYLLKVLEIILDYPNVAGFLIFETFCLGSSKTLPNVWKKYHKNERHLCLVRHTFTKLSQNMYKVITHILIYCHARCECKLWNTPWFDCVFWLFFILNWRPIMSELYCFFTKFSQIVCLNNI